MVDKGIYGRLTDLHPEMMWPFGFKFMMKISLDGLFSLNTDLREVDFIEFS